jgi:hypothetical protein
MPDFTHLRNARAVAEGDENHRARTEDEARVRSQHEICAAEYVRRVAAGDGALAYLHELRNQVIWKGTDPWRLLEAAVA